MLRKSSIFSPPAFTTVHLVVLKTAHQLQVLRTIIVAYAIDVVDYLITFQWPAKNVLHDDAMLQCGCLGCNQHIDVSIRTLPCTALPEGRVTHRQAPIRAFVTTESTLSLSHLPRWYNERLSAVVTHTRHAPRVVVARSRAVFRCCSIRCNSEWLAAMMAGKIDGHSGFLSRIRGVNAGAVSSSARLSVSSIISQNSRMYHAPGVPLCADSHI